MKTGNSKTFLKGAISNPMISVLLRRTTIFSLRSARSGRCVFALAISSTSSDQFGLKLVDPAGQPVAEFSFEPVAPGGGNNQVPKK